MTPQQIEAIKLGIEALKWCHGGEPCGTAEAITALEKALAQPEQERCEYCKRGLKTMCLCGMKAQPEQEPVTWGVDWGRAGQTPCVSIIKRLNDGRIEVVAVEYGPQRTWVGLTDEEICPWFQENTALTNEAAIRITRAIEAKLKEKNT